MSLLRDPIERLAGAGPWAFAVPLAAFAVLDFACRLGLASLLELLRPSAGLLPAVGAAAIGVGVDLVFVLPAYAVLAFAPRRATRALTGAVFAACLAILTADAIYFFNTFEHIEPVLFNNVNRSSVLGSVAGAFSIGAAFAALAYAADERALLEQLGLLRATAAPPDREPAFDRIVFLVMESMPAAYLHHYNAAIPAAATPFLDELLRRHPHADRFFTANMPTDYGLNSLFLSRLGPDWSGGRESLFSVLRREAGFESHFVRAVSKHYGNQLFTYPRIFRFDHFVAFEELQSRYQSQWHSGWGDNNATVYEERLRILAENPDRKLVLVAHHSD